MAARIRSTIDGSQINEASREDALPGEEVTLYSIDSATTYDWTLTFTPDDVDGNASSASLSSSSNRQVTFTPDNEGSYLVRLTVDEGMGSEDTQYIRIRVLTSFGRLRLVASGERKDNVVPIPVDIDATGWADDQNYNLLALQEKISRVSTSGRVLYVDANRGADYAGSQNDPSVAKGYADHFSIQSAINAAVVEGASLSTPWVVYVRPGRYVENLTLPSGVYVLGESLPFEASSLLNLRGAVELEGTVTIATTGSPYFAVLHGLTIIATGTAITTTGTGAGAGVFLNGLNVRVSGSSPAIVLSTFRSDMRMCNVYSPTVAEEALSLNGPSGTIATIRNCDLFCGYGIDANPTNVASYQVYVRDSRIHASMGYCLQTWASLSSIERCTFTQSIGSGTIFVNPNELTRASATNLVVRWSNVGTANFRTVNLSSTAFQIGSSQITPVVIPDESALTLGYVEALDSGKSTRYNPASISPNFVTAQNLQDAIDQVVRKIQQNSTVYVSQLSDLPDPVGNVITLEPFRTYFFTTFVDLEGNRLVCGENTTLLGSSSENCGISSSSLTGALITSTKSLPMRHLTLTADLVLDLDASGVGVIDWYGVNFKDCTEIGRIVNYDNVIINSSAFLNSSDLLFDGSFNTIGFDGCLFNGSFGNTIIEVPPTCIVSRRFRIIYSSFVTEPGETGIEADPSSFNPESFILDTVNFSGTGTYLSGIDYSDDESLIVNCVGVINSTKAIHYYMTGNTTPTIFAGSGIYTKILGSTSVGDIVSKFEHSDNQATYVGAIPGFFQIAVDANVSGTANKEFCIQIRKNGNPLTYSTICAVTNSSGKMESVGTHAITSLSDGDYIEVWIATISAETDVTVTDLNVIIQKGG